MKAVVAGSIGDDIEFEHAVDLAAGETRQLEISPTDFPQLSVDQPRLWWPTGMGDPDLYDLDLNVTVDGHLSDQQNITFGIRHIGDYLTEEGHRGYTVNGKKLLIRGGGWVDDLMLADDDQRLEDQIRYVQHMNLNTIRLEGFWGSSHRLFDLADRYGILVMVGWSCQWEWEEYLEGPVDEYGGIDTPAEIDLITRSLRDQVLWLRNHPSVFVWVLGSDMLPRPELERRYLAELAEVDPTRPALASCAVDVSEVSGPSGVKMNGPYDWVPPIYWYVDRERGGAYGFNTETGPGPQPPPVESIRRMMPEENWWPVDEMWDFHSGRNQFNTIETYHEALDARYGEATDLEDFARKAQIANYEGMRAMFEAFSIRRPVTTGHHPVDAQLGLAGDVLAALRPLPGAEWGLLRGAGRLTADQYRFRPRRSWHCGGQRHDFAPRWSHSARESSGSPVQGPVRRITSSGCASGDDPPGAHSGSGIDGRQDLLSRRPSYGGRRHSSRLEPLLALNAGRRAGLGRFRVVLHPHREVCRSVGSSQPTRSRIARGAPLRG